MTDRRPGPHGRSAALQCVRRRWGALRDLRGTGDDGMALPIVVALMVVSALFVTGVTAASLSAVGSTTSTRAAVQSQASAEAGLAAAQASIMAGTLACAFSSTGSVLAYDVQVAYTDASGGEVACAAGTGTAPAAGVVKAVVVSTGSAGTRSTQGNASGDTRRLQGVMTLTTTSTSATAPPTNQPTTPPPSSTGDFTRAVFVGTGGAYLTNRATVDGGSATSGGLYVNGPLKCDSNATISGPTVVWGALNLAGGGRCAISSDLTVAGGVTSCNGATITGTLTVRDGGTLSGCTVKGDAYFGGDITCDGEVQGLLSVQGKVTGNNTCTVGGDLRVAGDITKDKYRVTGAAVSTSGTLSQAQGSVGQLTVHHDPAGTGDYQGMTVGGRSCSPSSWWPVVTPGCTWTVSTTSPSPPRSPVSVPTSATALPVVTATTFGAIDALWPDFVRSRYAAHGGTNGRFASDSATCSITAPDRVHATGSGGSSESLDGPIDAPGPAQVVDARACATLTLKGARFLLNGDLTILVNNLTVTNTITVDKSPSMPANVTPVLRFVVPMASPSSSCADAGSAGTISVSENSKMGSDVSVLFYSAGTTKFNNSTEFYGQVYSCKLDGLSNSFAVHYRSLGPSSSQPASGSGSGAGAGSGAGSGSGAGAGSGAGSGASAWNLTDVRDLSRG